MTDILQRFVFEEAPVRGAVVSLSDAWRHVLDRRAYPDAIRSVLGEMMAASVLMAANLKFDGSLILQIHGTGALRLAVAECNHDRTVRATAKWDGDIPDVPLRELIGENARFVLTLEPRIEKAQTWQGIVALDGDTVAAMLENYMLRSEQLETRLILSSSDAAAGGMLLQRLPDGHGDPDGWPRAKALASTLASDELLELDAATLLHRLFHEETLRLFDEETVAFACTCSRERVGDMLKMLGGQEVGEVLLEQGSVEIACDFCHQRYVFDEDDANELFEFDIVAAARESRH
ncbi:Hsp33 family molecular chaperone HslO [Paludibacterium paludis]|uniref:33 kDa chaperonin n=1 Tax=Paludibacterium paludis TaxID=1225769 RepID=A0A918UBM3_9NEIS|nr:Hsp33 family molecular chaperone HslO [Paludibacterium paludis]GGY24126.1 33 kDa chaperonin [Paludibacterium paludis]